MRIDLDSARQLWSMRRRRHLETVSEKIARKPDAEHAGTVTGRRVRAASPAPKTAGDLQIARSPRLDGLQGQRHVHRDDRNVDTADPCRRLQERRRIRSATFESSTFPLDLPSSARSKERRVAGRNTQDGPTRPISLDKRNPTRLTLGPRSVDSQDGCAVFHARRPMRHENTRPVI